MRVQIESILDTIRSSFFFVPMLFVVGGVLLGELGVTLDERITTDADLPFRLTATVDSARLVLSVVAGATITFAGIAFSVSLLIISLTSSQYSPRAVSGVFRDPFNKRVIGIVVGTFAYCLVVIRSVRGPLEEGGTPVVPSLSAGLAVLFGLVAILSIVAFINHSAHTMNISTILHRITGEGVAQLRSRWTEDPSPEAAAEIPAGAGFQLPAGEAGWVQQLDEDTLLGLVQPGGILRVETGVGRYVTSGSPLGTLWPFPEDPDAVATRARQAADIGRDRTTQQDVSYSIRQLADIALRALSPGINDPTTAQDAIFHMAPILEEMLHRHPPARVTTEEGRTIVNPHRIDHAAMVALAFDEIRLAAAGQPSVARYLLAVLHRLSTVAADDDHLSRILRRQADLVLEGTRTSDLLDADRDLVEAAYAERFGGSS